VGWRQSELAALSPEVVALGGADSRPAARRAIDCTSKTRYGLDETAFAAIERLDVDDPGPEAERWLAERVGRDDLLVVFPDSDVFRVSAGLFVERWRDMFCPSRDDAVVLPAGGGWALFYSHEDEFEFARGGPAEPLGAPDRGGGN